MNVAEIIDENLFQTHGNRQGLSYGQLAVLLLTYIVGERKISGEIGLMLHAS